MVFGPAFVGGELSCTRAADGSRRRRRAGVGGQGGDDEGAGGAGGTGPGGAGGHREGEVETGRGERPWRPGRDTDQARGRRGRIREKVNRE